jgi:formylglycine-generating enzyme
MAKKRPTISHVPPLRRSRPSGGADAAACCGPGARVPGYGRPLEPVGGGPEQTGADAPSPTVAAPLAWAAALDLPGGTFRMGSDDPTFPQDHEGPVRDVTVGPLRIDAHAVTNARFGAFVADTGHVTDAERYGWSFVFHAFLRPGADVGPAAPGAPWWRAVRGACWSSPEGPGSHVEARLVHPVVHASWRDARAFATWAGGRLPTEAEWEYAARGGLDGRRFPWGDELEEGGRHRCNVWQGEFPRRDEGADGHRGTAPVDAFEPNGFGLFNVVGNVWEWCEDPFAGRPGTRVQKGGSYLCHASYCNRYRVAARTSGAEDDGAGHTGFRVAYG